MLDGSQWEQQVQSACEAGQYEQATQLVEQAIALTPECKDLYWTLGLLLLLQDRTEEAQATWLTALLDGDTAQSEQWHRDLAQRLTQAAQQHEEREQIEAALLLRQQLQELEPADLENSLHLLRLRLQQPAFSGADFEEIPVAALLREQPEAPLSGDLLCWVVREALNRDPSHPATLDFLAASAAWAAPHPERAQELTAILSPAALDLGLFKRQMEAAIHLCQLILTLEPQNTEILSHLSNFYQDSDAYEAGIATAYRFRGRATNLPDLVFGDKLTIKALMSTGGHWPEAKTVFHELEKHLQALVAQVPKDLTPLQVSRLHNSCFFAPYFCDTPAQNRHLQNQVAALCQHHIQYQLQDRYQRYQHRHYQRRQQDQLQPRPKLRLGYLSYCLKTHSVGWLARSLIQHHDRDRFEIYLYMVATPDSFNPLQEWYVSQSDRTFKSADGYELAQKIASDEVDVLIDLDSITTDLTCNTLALKPAPVQVTWLGWDASGLPAIDYFIADPYVLPATAQAYYRETIYRLPQTYLAIDGFEVGLPTRRREDLQVPPEAVLYYSVQKGYKRHPDTMRLQLKIIKAVPNSYFLLKGSSDTEAMQESFYQLADQEGVARDRLRFLDVDPTEATHRANLGLADIVLDTYPYNGATTTMETLWMGVPLVTRVGEQFSARNSYTMLMNAGVAEGIAWSDAEYVEWGVRFGTDANLRQKVAWQLRQGRRTAPLWHGRQFTREMEQAYETMWSRYAQAQEA